MMNPRELGKSPNEPFYKRSLNRNEMIILRLKVIDTSALEKELMNHVKKTEEQINCIGKVEMILRMC